MKVFNLINIAITTIKRNKMRSLLTMLGVIIGVASVIAMLAIGEGSNESIKSTISSMGTNLINVSPVGASRGGVQFSKESAKTLELKDVDFIKENSTLIQAISPEVQASGQVILGSKNWPSKIYGGNEDYNFIKKIEVANGRMFTDQEIKSASKVCLIGQTVLENLFEEGEDPVGKTIRFKNIPIKIIGVLEAKGENTFGQDQDDLLLSPYTTVMKRINPQTHLNAITMSAVSEDKIDEATVQVEEALRLAHKLKESEDNDFNVKTQQDLISSFGSISEMMLVLLGSIAGISLLVGGIGIMNIMYVSVTERTKEIGLRLSIGAKSKDILLQFLWEATLLSVFGGVLGVIVGIFASHTIEQYLGWPILITLNSVMLSFLFCTFVGIFFGWYPAQKASRLNPIDALRHE